MPSKSVIAATSPLHYVYYRQQFPLNVIASSRGLFPEYTEALGFGEGVQLYDVPNSPEALIDTDTSQASYISWKPAKTIKPVLGNDYDRTHPLEQKAFIRQIMPKELFPEFMVILPDELAAIRFDQLSDELKTQRLVVQIDDSTGGKGTFFIESEADFTAIFPILQDSEQTIVVSKRIEGTSRGIQCLLLGGQLYLVPWWHQDLVGFPEICDLSSPTATRYCGAILENIPEQFVTATQELCQTVATILNGRDYYGIFGIDAVVEEATGKVYLIEVNPRFTAVSHVYASAMRTVGYGSDFMTAHVQGLVEGMASVATDSLGERHQLPASYYYLKLQNQSSSSVQLSDTCSLGVYDAGGVWQRLGWGIDALQKPTDLVVIPEVAHGVDRQPGGRVFSVIGQGNPLVTGKLEDQLRHRLRALSDQFLLPPSR